MDGLVSPVLIEGGRLWFQLECDNTLGIMGISGRPINDGLWHAVALELTHNYSLLSLDDSYVERRRAARAPVRLWPLAPDSSFFFGAQVRPPPGPGGERGGAGSGASQSEAPGEPRDARGPPRAQDGFQGCLGSLRLNGNELPLQNKRSRYAEVAGLSEVKLGCVLYPDPCVSQPCLNGAPCSSLPSGGQWDRERGEAPEASAAWWPSRFKNSSRVGTGDAGSELSFPTVSCERVYRRLITECCRY